MDYLPKTIVGDFDGDGDLDFYNGSIYTKFFDDASQSVIFDDIYFSPSEEMYRTDQKETVTIKCLEEGIEGFKLMNRDSWCKQYSLWEGGKKTKIIFDIHSIDLINKTSKINYSKQFEIPSSGRNEFNALAGDFNGDGLTDKIIFRTGNTVYTTGEYLYDIEFYFVNLDRRITSNYVKNLGVISKIHYNGIQTGDVNGDGKTDLIFFTAGSVNSIVVYTFDENDNLTKLWGTPYSLFQSLIMMEVSQ